MEAAVRYAARGWPVLPLWWPNDRRTCSCGNRGCRKSVGKHPLSRVVQNGVDGATCDSRMIRAWWARYPLANVAIRTGAVSGLVVLDVDPRNGGDESLLEFEAQIGPLPTTPRSLTGGGGLHMLFQYPVGHDVRSRTSVLPGLDVKANGGFIVAPPSRHASGREYAWDTFAHPDDMPLAAAPDRLFSLFSQGSASERLAYTPEPWDGTVPLRALAAMEGRRSRLRQRFERHTHGLRDTSPSGADASLAALAALAGCTPQEVEATVRASRKQAGLPQRGASYYRATVGKALAIAAERDAKTERFERLFFGGLDHA